MLNGVQGGHGISTREPPLSQGPHQIELMKRNVLDGIAQPSDVAYVYLSKAGHVRHEAVDAGSHIDVSLWVMVQISWLRTGPVGNSAYEPRLLQTKRVRTGLFDVQVLNRIRCAHAGTSDRGRSCALFLGPLGRWP